MMKELLPHVGLTYKEYTTELKEGLENLVLVDPDRIPSTTPGAEPPRDAKDSGSARSHSTHLETSSSNRP